MTQPEISQILVLGGGIATDGSLGFLSVERAQRAAHLLEFTEVERVVFSGGTSWLEEHADAPRSEAEMMAELAVELGVPESVIECEDESTNTLTNIARSRRLLDEAQPVGIVTHRFHMPRTLRIARKLLSDRPVPISPDKNYPELRTHEFIASGISAIILFGLEQGDCDEAIRRNDSLQERLHKSREHIPSFLRPGLPQNSN